MPGIAGVCKHHNRDLELDPSFAERRGDECQPGNHLKESLLVLVRHPTVGKDLACLKAAARLVLLELCSCQVLELPVRPAASFRLSPWAWPVSSPDFFPVALLPTLTLRLRRTTRT